MDPVTILVVDDKWELAVSAKRQLEKSGFRVVAMANDARGAVTLTQEKRPNLVLMDIRMPKLSGVAAAKVIWKLYVTPVVFLTSFKDDRDSTLQAGAFGFVTRSMDRKDLQQESLTAAVACALYNYDTYNARTQEYCFAVDPSGCLLSVSKSSAELIGCSPDEVQGRRFDELLSLASRLALRDLLKRVLSERKSLDAQVEIVLGGGQRIPIEADFTPVYLNGDAKGISIVAREKRPSLSDERLRTTGETPIPELPLVPIDSCEKRVVSGMATQERVVTASVERFWSGDLLAVSFREEELGWRELDLPAAALPTGLMVGDRFPMTVFYDSQRRIRNWSVDASAMVDRGTQPPPHPLHPKKPRNWNDPSDVARYRAELDRLFKRKPDQESDSGAES
jgi:PAS domain S-box-containing protein